MTIQKEKKKKQNRKRKRKTIFIHENTMTTIIRIIHIDDIVIDKWEKAKKKKEKKKDTQNKKDNQIESTSSTSITVVSKKKTHKETLKQAIEGKIEAHLGKST